MASHRRFFDIWNYDGGYEPVAGRTFDGEPGGQHLAARREVRGRRFALGAIGLYAWTVV